MFTHEATHPVYASNNDPVDCCLQVSETRIPLSILKGFQIQTLEDGCYIEAVVFITKKSASLCAPPNQQWVHRLINRLKNLAQSVNRKHGRH
ncbi:C-C motif chemokine 19-like isoform X2 [Ambystoma mexicanum]|uniref:C-C motif chemokine 19-like isoform X2 n=1 Tax=Ambystoma mexicanum TaxID=8296 RepID=UPI0037E9B9D9